MCYVRNFSRYGKRLVMEDKQFAVHLEQDEAKSVLLITHWVVVGKEVCGYVHVVLLHIIIMCWVCNFTWYIAYVALHEMT